MFRRRRLEKRGAVVAFATVLLLIGGIAYGDDFASPDWRGFDGTTCQQWTFQRESGVTPGMIYPDDEPNYSNPFDPSYLVVDDDSIWLEPDDWHDGAWALGELDIIIPNSDIIDGYKLIWLQLTWRPYGEDPYIWDQPLVGAAADYNDPLIRPDSIEISELIRESAEGDWVHSLFEIYITPNPLEEWIAIKGDIAVDQVVVDTYCIPEPATMALLGLGGAFLLRVRTRRKQTDAK